MEKIKAFLYSHPKLFNRILKAWRILRPSHVKRMWRYQTGVAGPERKKLKTYGFAKIRYFNTPAWRFGMGLDHAYRRYYTAIREGEKVFIKVAKNDATIENEIIMGEKLLGDRVLLGGQPVVSDRNFAESTMMLAMPFETGLASYSLPDTREEFETQCRDFLAVLAALEQLQVIHGDIHKNNLMLNSHKQPVLLDYGISMIKGQENKVDYRARPGTFYTETEQGVRTYDDAYSFVMMLEQLGVPENWKDTPSYVQIKNRVGMFAENKECGTNANTKCKIEE